MRNALGRLFNLQPGDGRRGALLFAYLFLVITCYQGGKAARDALFLSVFNASKLPYADMAIAASVGVVFAVYVTIGRRMSLRNLLVGSLLLFAAMAGGFWYLAHYRPDLTWQFPVFYIWVGIFGVLAPTQVWTLANYVLTTREAKRVFGLVGAGAITGWIFSGMLTRALASIPGLGTESLLLAMAIGLVLCSLLVVALWRERGRGEDVTATGTKIARPHELPPGKNLGESLKVVFSSPYLIAIASLITLSSVATTFAGWQFKAIAKIAYPDKNVLTAFFGTFNFWVGVACLVLQLLLTSRFLRRFGLGPALLVVPAALFAGEIAVFAAGTLLTAVLLKGSDQLLRYSLDKSSVELLYLPIPPEVKLQAKSCIDTFIWRLGDGIAGLTLAVFTDRLHWSPQRVSVVNFLFIGCWMVAAVAARGQYAGRLLESIRQRRLDAERQLAPVLDRSTNEILARELSSSDPAEVLYALKLLGVQRSRSSHPALEELLTHPDAAVRKGAIEALDAAANRWALPKVEPLLKDTDPAVRTAALLFIAHHAHVDPLTLVDGLDEFAPYSIESAIVAFLAHPGGGQHLDAARLLMDKLIGQADEPGKGARLEAAELIATLPDEFGPQLDRLLEDSDPEVVRAALRAAGRLRRREHASRLVALLGDERVRAEAVEALVAIGDRLVGTLRDDLHDPDVAPEVGLEIPAVLARIGSPGAALALTEALLASEPELRYRVIAALNDLRRHHPGLVLDEHQLHAALALEMMHHCRTNQLLSIAGPAAARFGSDRPPSVRARLEEQHDLEVERIFRLLSLLHPGVDFHSAHYGLRSADPTARDHALEFLDLTLDSELRKVLVPLLDPTAALEERVVPILRRSGMEQPTRDELVAALVDSSDPWFKACGLSAVGALGLQELAGAVEASLDSEDELVRETARSAKRHLAAVARA